MYESSFSSYHQVYVSADPEPVLLPADGLNMLMMAVVFSVITSILMILTMVLCCHRKQGDRRRYEIVSTLSPTKCQPKSKGWGGDLETDIPASLFPKHVQVIHNQHHLSDYQILLGFTCIWRWSICQRFWYISSNNWWQINVLWRWRTCCILCRHLGPCWWIHSDGFCWILAGYGSLETHLGHSGILSLN